MPIIMSERNDYIKKAKQFLLPFARQMFFKPLFRARATTAVSVAGSSAYSLPPLSPAFLFLLHLLPSLWLIVLAFATNASGITKQFCAIANGI